MTVVIKSTDSTRIVINLARLISYNSWRLYQTITSYTLCFLTRQVKIPTRNIIPIIEIVGIGGGMYSPNGPQNPE